MTLEQAIVYVVILLTLVLPMWSRWRYDLAAVLGVVLLAVLGIVSATEAFAGYGHPAVITVAAVLVVSRGLQKAAWWMCWPVGSGAWVRISPCSWRRCVGWQRWLRHL